MGGEDTAEAKDYCLQLVNLLDALQDAEFDVKSYRTHCLELVAAAQKLRPGVNEVLAADPSFGFSKEAREGLQSPINLLQDGLGVIRKCSQLTGLAKMLDHGNMKARLEELIMFVKKDTAQTTLDLHHLLVDGMPVVQADAFLKLSVSRFKSQKKAEKLQALRQGTAHATIRQ